MIERYANAEGTDFPPQKFAVDVHAFSERATRTLVKLIRRSASETAIHDHFLSHPGLFAFSSKFFRTGHHGCWMIPKAQITPRSLDGRVGSIPDYLLAGHNSDGITWWVVELKGANARIFDVNTRNDIVPSDALRDGLAQLNRYMRVCSDQKNFMREYHGLNTFSEPYGIIIIGRERELIADKRKQEAKARMNREGTIQIRTYDAFVRELASLGMDVDKLSWLSRLSLSLFTKNEITPDDRDGA